MNIGIKQLIEDLNHRDAAIRLNSLGKLMQKIDSGEVERPAGGNDVNNHIHTSYSFSPYSPTKAIWMAYAAGLATAGIMDHDSIGGAEEFITAGKIAGIATTVGVECRADFSQTSLNGRRINNPDQDSIAYIALHGIPHTQFGKVRDFFKPYNEHRNIRNMQMVAKLNDLVGSAGVSLDLDFDKDVIPLSGFHEGGSITERHIIYALSMKLLRLFGKGSDLLGFLTKQLKLCINPKIEGYLKDLGNPHYEYDLLGLLKGELTGSFYIDAAEECPDIKEVVGLSRSTGAILAYAYLGDVKNSVTGDKRTQKFEDAYIEKLFAVLREFGFNAVTYMPSRNSMDQLEKVRRLCVQYGFLQISGEDINSSRQSFICEALRNVKFKNLIDAAWALIGHELAATEKLSAGMFSPETVGKYPSLEERVRIYKEIGLKLRR